MTHNRGVLTVILIVLGAGWGLTLPLTKITVTAGYAPFGIIFWQMLIGAVVLATLQWRRIRQLPFGPRSLAVWLMIAIIGTLIPNGTSLRAALHLPAGIMSIIIATLPMMAFPMALAMGNDRFSWRRLVGLTLGICGVALIALPDASLPERAMAAFLPLALIAPFCYALEGNLVARFGTGRLDPVQALFGASALGAAICLPLALQTGHFFVPRAPFQLADLTLLASSIIHVLVYTTYVWLVGQTGSVFAGQVSYLVTGSGVLWSMLLLAERYSGWVWAALALMILGLTLVQPRRPLATALQGGETSAQ